MNTHIHSLNIETHVMITHIHFLNNHEMNTQIHFSDINNKEKEIWLQSVKLQSRTTFAQFGRFDLARQLRLAWFYFDPLGTLAPLAGLHRLISCPTTISSHNHYCLSLVLSARQLGLVIFLRSLDLLSWTPVLCSATCYGSLSYSLKQKWYQQCSALSVFYLDLLALRLAPCSLYVCFLVSTVLWFSLVLCLAESLSAAWIGTFPPLISFAPLDPCPALGNFFKRLLVIFVGRTRNTSVVATTHTATRNHQQWCCTSQSSGASSPSHELW